MPSIDALDAIVIGSGPNGLAAALTLARAGLSVRVYERNATPGGGMRTDELTLPGFLHDQCSAVHPLAFASGFFRRFELDKRVRFVTPTASYAHPLDGGRAAVAYLDLERTADALGVDGPAWRAIIGPLAREADAVAQFTGSQLFQVPRHPLVAARFGLTAIAQGGPWWNIPFRTEEARAMLTGVFAHTTLPLPSVAGAAAGLTLASYAHARGWPVPIGGSQSIVTAMVDDLVAHGGELVTGVDVQSLADLPDARVLVFDTHVEAAARLAQDRLPASYLRRVSRFRSGNGVCKVDFALSGPVPWANPELNETATVHLGGTRSEVARAETTVASGRESDDPYVLVSQPSLFDGSRAPAGKHVLWAYTHVPAGSRDDRTEAVIRQIERFAPGFRDLILATAVKTAVDMEAYNPNYSGGDISTGLPSFSQLIARPVASPDPWRMPGQGLYLASASAAPGPGVHGLGGYYAARSALRHDFGFRSMPSLAPA
ncbi:NAD(P)/FAD-dependent oxidoreductase [Leifsonia sp. F6_8S_P_1B]|uniref:NAD(P)/FAD-dependent oxidoreductase n=1 Tax=Leifsonia williamsii TaxID=3035919 RepID=A0ABT8K687_9MICO|nr:NAD(P)/FAD-dependent oxidoreductase [Leifsonia williamsii]MDN4612965.1 NAD(P)/FAD-dependent oxidoreductase [Leifsonia williamsii]